MTGKCVEASQFSPCCPAATKRPQELVLLSCSCPSWTCASLGGKRALSWKGTCWLEAQDRFPYVARAQWVTGDRVLSLQLLKPDREQTIRGKNIAILYFPVEESIELRKQAY